MAEPKPITTQTDFFTKAEDFFEHNKKLISYSTSALLLIIVAVVYINNFYLPGREKEAKLFLVDNLQRERCDVARYD